MINNYLAQQMALKRNTRSINIAIDFTIRAFGSNKSERVSAIRSFYYVTSTLVKIFHIVLGESISCAMAETLAKIFIIEELEKYIDTIADMNNFKIDFNHSLG